MPHFIPAVTVLLALTLSLPLHGENTVYSHSGGRVKTLDPAMADDLSSRNMCGSVFDTLLQYDYTGRPYRLIPSMLAEMPAADAEYKSYIFTLRDDLYFADDPCFSGMSREERKITSSDVLYSIMRIADRGTHSPVYWMFRGKIAGLDEFRDSDKPEAGYSAGISGFTVIDDRRFRIDLTRGDPRFLYILAMPNAGIVPRRAVEFYGRDFARHPVGSGPFILEEFISDCRIVLRRNPDYRAEFFPGAENPADRGKPLPLADKIVFCQVRQPMTAWLLFLQGNLDMTALDKDNLDTVAGGGELSPALSGRGVRLDRAPECEVRYVGFNFADPLLGNNPELRRALSLAYNVRRRIEHSGHQLLPANGPIPPGVAGYDENYINPYSADDPEAAERHLALSGLQSGGLHLTFDQNGSSTAHRQIGELTADDFARIGIRVTPVLNNAPRFFDKLRRGELQMFRLSWTGDYPDAENFLQLFYSGNIGGCNRTGFSDPVYDRMFEEILPMPDSPERTAKYKAMCRYLAEQCPWIFESFPVSYQLRHAWLQNWLPHDFAFNRWKYISVNAVLRERMKQEFTPLSFRELSAPAEK